MKTVSSVVRGVRTWSIVFVVFAVAFGGFFVASDANALISGLTISAPVTNDEWRGVQTITWSTVPPSDPETVDLYLEDSLGNSVTIALGEANDGSYTWNTTATLAGATVDGTGYKIVITRGGFALPVGVSGLFTLDNTDPVTTYAIVPAIPDGIDPWYVNTPTITLTCTDNLSGCSHVWYQWDSNTPGGFVDGGVGPVLPLISEGTHTLYFYSEDEAVDNLGDHNAEGVQSEVVNVDTQEPTVSVTSATPAGAYNAGEDIDLTLTFNEPVTTIDTITVTLETGVVDRTCIVSILTSDTVGSCTYTVQPGDTSSDLNVNSIVPTSGDVLDVAGNSANLVPGLGNNLSDNENIVIDTTAPAAFVTGAVTVTGGNVVVGWWNSTNAGVDVEVPVDNDASLEGGTVQLQAEADGVFTDIGSAYVILNGDLGNTVTLSVTEAELEALTGFSDADVITFRAVITDLAGNPTTGGDSVVTFTVDQTLPSVDAGTDKEVNALVAQDATTSDGGSGIATWLWTQQDGPPLTITFGTPAAEDTTINGAVINGTYTLRLTVTDVAGNSAFEEIQFAWDTIAPILTQVTPIANPTNDSTPSYVFNVNSVKQLAASIGGGVTYGGSCGNGDLASAVAGDNTTTYTLLDATYPDCTISVTDAAGNTSLLLAIPSFEVDTVVAVVSTITTEDVNLDGRVDRATIVFTDEVNDVTFSVANFMIGGVAATNFSTGGLGDDATIVLDVAGGVAGTEAKTVAYTPGTATDLAGNSIAGFSQTSTDAAKPVLLSAQTTSTTTAIATFSEDLDGTTVNAGGNEFTVAGSVVTAASETSAGVVTLTYAPALGTGAEPLVTYTEVDALNDLAGVPNTAVTPGAVTAVDGVAPTLSPVHIQSNNALNTALAKSGDVVTLTFTSSETITAPTVTIHGLAATSVTNVGDDWTATRTMTGADADGNVTFSIAFADDALPLANAGVTVTVTTDLSAVLYDKTAPSVNAGTDKEVNAQVSQDATTSDLGSGLNTHQWTKESGPGVVTFSTATAVDTTISADTDGTYVIRLTVTDNAGNSAFDEITFIWDTTRPEPLTSSPSDGTTGVSTAAGMATVTYDEDIVLLNANRVELVNDVTVASHKGLVEVSGGNGNSGVLNINYSGLAAGTKYRINVKPNALRDVAGNVLATNLISYFTTQVDTGAPVVTSFSAGSITTTSAVLSVTTNENATCRFATTDSDYATMTPFATTGTTTHSHTVGGLTESTGYDYYVRCADVSAQLNTMTTSAHVSFMTLALAEDTTPPTVPVITTASTTTDANTYVIAGTVADDGGARTITLYNGTDAAGTVTIPAGDTTWSLVVPLVQSALNSFTATAADVAGNVSAASAAIVINEVPTAGDTTAPTVPAITTAATTVDSATLTLTGTAGADAPIDGPRTITITRTVGATTTVVGSLVLTAGETDWSFSAPLTQNAANVFTATSTDEAGHSSAASASVTITEVTAADATPPVISDIHTGTINQTSTTANWDTDEPSDSQVEYGLTSSYGSITLLTATPVIGHTKTLSGLIPGTLYHYRVLSRDAAGNLAVSGDNVFTTAPSTNDTTAPTVTNVQVISFDQTSATVTWTTDELASSQIEFGTSSAYGSLTVADNNLVTSHTVNLTGLAPGTTYHFRVKSRDASLNLGMSDDQIFQTLGAPNPPVVPGVTAITAIKTFATADDTYTNGWEWVFDVTLPTSEPSVSMKFADWVSGGNTIAAGGNMQFFSTESSNADTEGTAIEITAANTYAGFLNLDTDLDLTKVGTQIRIHVQVKVPATTAAGSYSTSYGIKSE